MKDTARWWQIGCLALLVSLCAGCAGLPLLGGGGYATTDAEYRGGVLKATDSVSFETAWYAARDGLRDLGFRIVGTRQAKTSGNIVGRRGDHREATVYLEKKQNPGQSSTGIAVRADDEPESLLREILHEIRTRY